MRASLRGWIFCRDNFDACVDIVMAAGPELPRGHMEWQLNEINALIWPSPGGIGVMDGGLWSQTLDVATSQGVLSARPGDDSYRSDIAENALAGIDEDTTGSDFSKRSDIVLKEGGE